MCVCVCVCASLHQHFMLILATHTMCLCSNALATTSYYIYIIRIAYSVRKCAFVPFLHCGIKQAIVSVSLHDIPQSLDLLFCPLLQVTLHSPQYDH